MNPERSARPAFQCPDVLVRAERGGWVVEHDGRFLYLRELQTEAIDCALDYARLAARGAKPYRVLLRTHSGAVIPVAGTPSPHYPGKVIDLAQAREARRSRAACSDARPLSPGP